MPAKPNQRNAVVEPSESDEVAMALEKAHRSGVGMANGFIHVRSLLSGSAKWSPESVSSLAMWLLIKKAVLSGDHTAFAGVPIKRDRPLAMGGCIFDKQLVFGIA